MGGGNSARDERRRKARYNREHTARRVAARSRERAKRHARGDYRPEQRAAYKAWLKLTAENILAQAHSEVAELGHMKHHKGGAYDLPEPKPRPKTAPAVPAADDNGSRTESP